MNYYLYDDTFDGLLTSIYEAFYSSNPPEKIVSFTRYVPNLFSETVNITTDYTKADKVYKAISEKISSEALKNIYYAYLSEIENIETAIYSYLKLGFKWGEGIDRRLSNNIVMKVHTARRKVSFENHRLRGLIRFRLLKKEIYYATIEPDHNVLCLLAPHFSGRMADQNWIIHDLKRELAVVYSPDSKDHNDWYQIKMPNTNQLQFSEEETFYQELWKTFFKTISIKDRTNFQLQKQHMPVRYWKHIIEKD